jgi:hypothetical protein
MFQANLVSLRSDGGNSRGRNTYLLVPFPPKGMLLISKKKSNGVFYNRAACWLATSQ